MPKCQNCGRWTTVTDDLICPYCNQLIAVKDQKKLLERHKKLLDRAAHFIQRLDQIGQEKTVSPKIEHEALKIWILSIIYLLIFVYIEYITYYISPSIGLIFNFIILFVLIVNISVVPVESSQKFLVALGLIPLIRIVSLVVPVAEIPQVYWYFIIIIPISVGIIGITRYLNYSFYDIGLNLRKLFIQLFIALVGIGLGIVDYIILKPESLVTLLVLNH